MISRSRKMRSALLLRPWLYSSTTHTEDLVNELHDCDV